MDLSSLTSVSASQASVASVILWTLAALVLGVAISAVHALRARTTTSFSCALALLPAIVCVVIAMVNGNLGAGVAVAGAFSLVRFRSAPGSGLDICFVFLAMAVGLVCGMGEVLLAALVTVVLGGTFLVASAAISRLPRRHEPLTLRVTVPEDLDYTTMLDDVLDEYASVHSLVSVRTANMGSLYKLTYEVTLRDPTRQRELIDAIRCRNGNLEVALAHEAVVNDAL